MATIRIPYAVGNLGTFVFKEISYSEYVKYSQAISELRNIYQQKYSGEVNVGAELARLRNDLRKKTHTNGTFIYCNETNLERWNKQRDEKIREINRILAPARPYNALIQNLTVTINGAICDVSCAALPMFGGTRQTVRQTLINRTAQIIR